MESWIIKLVSAIFGPTLILIIVGVAAGVEVVWQIGVGYFMLWLVFTAYILNVSATMDIKFSRWSGQNIKKLAHVESIKIPVGGRKFLIGDIIKSDVTPEKDAPVIIMCHGLGGSRKDFYMIAMALINRGYAYLSYDARGHGETKFGEKWDSMYIIKDLKHALDYIETRDDLSHRRIVAIGGSMGASVVLNEGYLDPRVDFVIGICAWSDYQATTTREMHGMMERAVKVGYNIMGINLDPSNLQSRMVSPIHVSFNRKKGFFDHPVPWEVDNDYRVCLSSCRDDSVINFANLDMNKEYLKLLDRNCLAFDEGDHAFAGMETVLVAKMVYWLEMRGY